MMPLEWLDQIRGHIKHLQQNLNDDQSYIGTLKQILVNQDYQEDD